MHHLLPIIFFVSLCSLGAETATDPPRPNVILIMVDDMGFSDLGCYGGEIDTPNIDALAAGGVKFAQFTNGARCCPTRASLMTGLHPHQTGIGHMTNTPFKKREPQPSSYQGYLNQNCATIGELLQPAGYTTLMTGKWHLGIHEKSRWPRQRGFDHFYGSLAGATRFFYPQHPRGMTDENTPIETPESTTDKAFYTTDAFTDHAIRFISNSTSDSEKPFFLYLAYTAPHWPLQAHEEDIAKYRGKYKIGWDKLREQRYQKQLQLGLIKPEWKLSPRPDNIPAWDSLTPEKQDDMDLRMATYAAMIDRVDQNIGKLTASLKKQSLFENTLILFLSDNGACHEGGIFGSGEFRNIERRNLQNGNSYGTAWANAGSTPFRQYKSDAHQGGVATPFIAHWPRSITPRADWLQTPAHITDVVPTILELAKTSYPSERNGHQLHPLEGKSLLPSFQGKPIARSQPLCLEHQGNAFIRDGDWKLVGKGHVGTTKATPTGWELYNLTTDRTELHSLAQTNPEKRDELIATWEKWAQKNKVFPKQTRTKKTKLPHNKALQILDEKIRDPFILLGPDKHYYLTGTTAGSHWGETVGIRLWRSKNLLDWQDLGYVWDLHKDGKAQPSWHHKVTPKSGVKNGLAIWAPEIHYMKGTWWIPHSLNVAGHGLLKSTSGKPEGPYVALPPISSEKGIDAHLFEEGEKTYYLWGADNLVSLNPDLSSTAGDIQKLRPPGKHPLGYEGIFLNKIDNKYLLIASGRYAYENDDTYDLYYSVGKNLNGPYGPRRMAVKNAGHGNLFQDKSGRWWATAFDHKHVTGKERWSPWIVPIEIKSSPDDLEIIVKDERFRPTEADQIQIKELRSTGIPKGREGLAPWEKPLPTKEESATPPIKNNPLSVDGHPFFGADPSAIVVPDGRLFLFPTTDNRDWEKQFGWSCYSSSDLVDWKNHGVIFSDKESGWGKNRAWAPDITHRDGKFYLYYYFNNGKGAPVKGVGVAVADQPEGPYKELSVDKPLVGGHDPAVFADTDGRYWLYLQDKVFELADDMASFKSGPTDLKLEYRPEKFEAAYVFKRNDLYYFTIARDWNNLIYYTAKSPTGPFKFRGEFFKKYGGNNHHSIVKYKGKWLIFYHEWVRENPTQQRQLRAEYLHFNPDGTIRLVEPTDQGVRFPSPLKSPPQKTK